MKKNAGLWIDHHEAVIVFVEGEGVEIKLISSNIEEIHRQSGDSMPADDIRQRELTAHLNSYYDEVFACVSQTKSILIFGPGEAKGEFSKRTQIDKYSGDIVGIEPADKMTHPQIVAKVRKHFLNPSATVIAR